MIKGVIFDLDGVLVSTDELHYRAWKQLADELHIVNFTKADNERQRGVSRLASLEVLLEKGEAVYTEEEKMELAQQKNTYYLELLQHLNEKALLPGAIETLKLIRNKGVPVAIGSASENTPIILQKTGLLPYIDQVSCGLDTKKSKPDPEVFVIAADKLGLNCDKCLVVEDSEAGIRAAKTMEMKTLAVGPLYKGLNADYCARDLDGEIDWEGILQ